jgi:hypothetical protein
MLCLNDIKPTVWRPTRTGDICRVAARERNAYFCLRIELSEERVPLSRPNWSRPLPRPLKIPTVMTLKTLADVRELVERRLPDGHRQRSTWQHVEKQLNAAALGTVDTVDVAVPLQMVLQLERVPCLPQ